MAELTGVSVVAGGTRILDEVTTRFPAGTFNVILGPNGAGKSTLLKVATGLRRPDRGDVRYGDDLVALLTPTQLARRRAVLSQHVDLAFPLRAEDVAMMGRYPHYGRAPSARDRDIVRQALALVGIEDRREQIYPTLSSGEQQKVQMARVLAQIWNYDDASQHKYLFLDEPTSTLDVHYQLQLLTVARDLLRFNCTVVAVLHDLNLAQQYGGHFLVLDGGRVAYEADSAGALPTDVLERVFRVRAKRVGDGDGGVWTFSL